MGSGRATSPTRLKVPLGGCVVEWVPTTGCCGPFLSFCLFGGAEDAVLLRRSSDLLQEFTVIAWIASGPGVNQPNFRLSWPQGSLDRKTSLGLTSACVDRYNAGNASRGSGEVHAWRSSRITTLGLHGPPLPDLHSNMFSVVIIFVWFERPSVYIPGSYSFCSFWGGGQ